MSEFETKTRMRKLPEWQYNSTPATNAVPGETLRWSGKTPPPAIGARVNAGQFGHGVVAGYFCEYGYLGIEVKLETPPAWLVEQRRRAGKRLGLARLFGVDLAETRS